MFSPNKKLTSAHASSFKLTSQLNTNPSNKSIEHAKQSDGEDSKDFFSKRKRLNNFQDSKLNDILQKIESKKQFIKQIEDRYHEEVPEYKSNAFLKGPNSVGLNPGVANHYYSPNVSTYVRMELSSNERVREHDTRPDNSIVKVIPPSHPPMPEAKRKKSKKQSRNRNKNSRKGRGMETKQINNINNQRYLNSWEQGGVAPDDDIKEELSNDESAYDKRIANEEGSAARRLLESMSRLAGNDDDTSDDSLNENEFVEGSLATFELINQAKKDGNWFWYIEVYIGTLL